MILGGDFGVIIGTNVEIYLGKEEKSPSVGNYKIEK